MQAKQTVLTCADQQTLSAQYYECDAAKGVVIIGSALGVSQHYYKRFACYLVEQGFHVLTFDYRFTGDSNACQEGAGLALQDWGANCRLGPFGREIKQAGVCGLLGALLAALVFSR